MALVILIGFLPGSGIGHVVLSDPRFVFLVVLLSLGFVYGFWMDCFHPYVWLFVWHRLCIGFCYRRVFFSIIHLVARGCVYVFSWYGIPSIYWVDKCHTL